MCISPLLYQSLIFINTSPASIYILFLSFFLASGGGLPLCPNIFTVYKVTLPVLRIFHCERCQIRTRDHAASVVRSATNEPPNLQQYVLPQSLPCIIICPVSISPLCLSLIFLNLYPVLYLQVSTQQQSLSCISLDPVLISPL